MRDAKPEIERLGARLVIVGNGQPFHAKDFAESSELQGAVYTDPERHVYTALGMKRGLGPMFEAKQFGNAWRALRSGHRQTATKGDPWQQGGTLVVSKDGELLYGHVSATGGDNAPVEAILSALGSK